MNARAKQIIMLALVAAFLFGSGRLQKSLDRDRATLGLTISQPLQDAPPVLALTTQALGGFRGLISNFLWMRADTLQMNDQFFEAAQLANWITDLEPHYSQVWAYEGWNMAWNISVKFKDFSDRWRWVTNGLVLLRDRGLQYNPDNVIIYQQLAWIFQNKMGEYLDDANNYYKEQWATEMRPYFGPNGTNFDALLHPQTAEDRTNVYVLIHAYKIDPVFAANVNEEWGPLDWRLPEAHAIYWASLGLQQAKEHPDKVNASDLIQLQRATYQSMMQAFQHGQIIPTLGGRAELGPNLAIISKVNDAYETMMREDPGEASHIAIAHRNFLLDAVYYLYGDNRMADAKKWYDYVGKIYPDKPILEMQPNSLPKNVTLDQYCVARVQGDVTDTSSDTATAAIENLLVQAYENLAMGQDDRYAGFRLLASKVYEVYMSKIDKYSADIARVGLPPFTDINHLVLSRLLDPQNGLPYEARAVIRSELRIPGDVNAPYGVLSTNSMPQTISPEPTNTPATTSAGE
jgi:hypothetical protein